MEYIIVTGLSGAGKTQATKVLEDMGYYCIDNLPTDLLPAFMDLAFKNSEELSKVALAMDIRSGKFLESFKSALGSAEKQGFVSKILFLEANKDVLIKRFKESRRTHPMNPGESLETSILKEIDTLSEIRNEADYIIDTSRMSHYDLKKAIYEALEGSLDSVKVKIHLMSFGFKKGIPMDSDFVFDLRFLPNPYYQEKLRNMTGNDDEVKKYVMSFKESQEYISKIKDLVIFVIEQCVKEARSQLIVSVGCTGGQHRSVTFVNILTSELTGEGYKVEKVHRDLL